MCLTILWDWRLNALHGKSGTPQPHGQQGRPKKTKLQIKFKNLNSNLNLSLDLNLNTN